MIDVPGRPSRGPAERLRLLSTRKAAHGPVLIVLCGPSHSGKTTFACKLGSCFTIISPDRIRNQLSTRFNGPEEDRVWDMFESSKRKALKAGRNLVLDACHMSREARWHALQGPNGRHRKICVVFDLPLRTVREWCVKDKRLPLREAKRMWRAFQESKPTAEELKHLGFDEVHFITENPLHAVVTGRQRCRQNPIIMEENCCSTSRRNHSISIFHCQRAGPPAWFGGQWCNNKGVNYG